MSKEISRRTFLKGAAATAVSAAGITLLGGTALAEETNIKTASATAKGFGGDVTVTLTVNANKGLITDCQIVGDSETPGVGSRAVAEMPAQYIEAGSLEVDGVSGATVSSNAIKNAARIAYNSAMGIVADSAIHMAPGKYTAGALGYWGIWELPVTITVNETSILKIETPDDRFAHGEAEVILQSAKDKLIPRIIESQSLEVDSIAGATASSTAIKVAVDKALREALVAGGTDESAVEYFHKAPPAAEITDPIEIDTDILIVGMGNGGIFAFRNAIEKIQEINGGKLCSVMAIDKAGKVGGKSALCHEFNAVNPPKYKEMFNNGEDFVDAEAYKQTWLDFTMGADGVQKAKPEMIELFVEKSGDTIDWLFDRGWRFGTLDVSPMAGGIVSYNSVLASNIDTGTYEDRRAGVNKYYKSFLSFCEAEGGKYMLETEGYEILTDGDRVTGIKARNNVTGQEYIIHCKALIMGCGGFSSNPDMLSKLLDPKWAGPRKTLGTGMDTGAMMQAALDIGAGTWNIEMSPNIMHVGIDHWLTKYPVEQLEGTLDGRTGRVKTSTLNDIPLGLGISSDCLVVNTKGERYVNEEMLIRFGLVLTEDSCPAFKSGTHYYAVYSKDRLQDIADNGFSAIPKWEGYCWQGGTKMNTPLPEVFDCLEACIAEGMAFKGDTVEDLAKQLGMDPAVLAGTVDAYNACVEAGEDTAFGKKPENLKPYAEGPFYAVEMKNVTFGTVGGLDVDTNIRVLKADHKTPFEGFYAIGLDSHGVLLTPEHNYIGFGGVAQGWYATSGLLASSHAVSYVNDNFGFTEVSPALVQTAATSSTH